MTIRRSAVKPLTPKQRPAYTRAHRLMMHVPDWAWVVHNDGTWEFYYNGKWCEPMTLAMAEKFVFAIDIPFCLEHDICKKEKLDEVRARVKAEKAAS